MEIRTIGNMQAQMNTKGGEPSVPQKAVQTGGHARNLTPTSPEIQQINAVRQAMAGIDEINEAVKRIGDSLAGVQSDLQFEVDTEAGDVIVKIINRQTQEVIKQIPSQTAIDLAKSMSNLSGRLVNAKA